MSNAETIDQQPIAGARANARARQRIRRRYAADRRLQVYGVIAIALAIGLLGVLLASIVANGFPAFVQSKADLPFFIDPAKVDPDKLADGNYRAIVREALKPFLAADATDKEKTEAAKVITADAPYILRDYVVEHPHAIGKTITLPVSLSDGFDQLNKGVIPLEIDALNSVQIRWFDTLRNQGLVDAENGREVLKLEVYVDPAKVEAGPPPSGDFAALATSSLQAYLPNVHDSSLGTILAADAPAAIAARLADDPALIGKTVKIAVPLAESYAELARGKTPKVLNPRFTAAQVRIFEAMKAKGLVHTPFNFELFLNADSRFPERAGLAGAITGTFLMLLVCFSLSFPIGIAAAVYLEEFAPKNRLTDLIEVNINNLAAVPSVVFGLLGLAVFLGFFGLPRSTPLVGGMVLSFVTLPTIIIATRAALKAVPPSIREAALGVGASRHQMVMHHVLPLAMPGILTGTIIGMAHALGETAPLLLIGMNAFIPSIESMGVFEPATTLPTQIFNWADSPERGFVSRTSAAILVLLAFLVVMNLLAIVLRQRFERKW
ncbi:MAG: phosphate ABC transporter permease PstA [Methyloceanibacter sp.]